MARTSTASDHQDSTGNIFYFNKCLLNIHYPKEIPRAERVESVIITKSKTDPMPEKQMYHTFEK